ncbi:MAG: sugar ABC transporter permease [Opitutaceae bacterium]|nr:sugar ABC transporter permease [Opitutaceae bacterium]
MKLTSRSKGLLAGLLFLLPNILGFLAFTLVPLVMSFGMAFTNWDFLKHNMFRDVPLHFMGLDNFLRLLRSADFWLYLGNTFYLMLGLPFAMAGSLGAALLLSRVEKGRRLIMPAMIVATVVLVASALGMVWLGASARAMWMLFALLIASVLVAGVSTGGTLYRTMFYLPNFTAGVATFVLWKKLYNPDTGPVNMGLGWLLDGVAGAIKLMPAVFAHGVPVICTLLIVAVTIWHWRRLRRLWDDSEAGIAAIVGAGVSLAAAVFFLLSWEGLGASLAWGAAALGLIVWVMSFARRPRPWGKPKASDKGLGTEVAVAMVLIPLFMLLIAGIVVGPGLPAAAAAGIPAPNWLADYEWAKPAMMIMMLWAAIGSNNMILYLAGLSSIPPELYEAADMDGASPTQRFWNITWPQLAPVTFFIAIMSVIGGLQGGFEMARAMTQGGPAGSTTTLAYFIYSEGFQNGRMGYASAAAWILFLFVFVLSVFNFRYGNRHVND